MKNTRKLTASPTLSSGCSAHATMVSLIFVEHISSGGEALDMAALLHALVVVVR